MRDGWIPFAAAAEQLSDGDFWRACARLTQALLNGVVKGQGVRTVDQSLVEISPDYWGKWKFNFVRQSLAPGDGRRDAAGYTAVKISRTDVAGLTQSTEQRGSPAAKQIALPHSARQGTARQGEEASRRSGKPSANAKIMMVLRTRIAAQSECDTLAGEAKWLYHWARKEFTGRRSVPTSVKLVENLIRDDYWKGRMARRVSVR